MSEPREGSSGSDDATIAGGAPPRPSPSNEILTLGHYRILEPLGQGGMGVVYRAYHPGLDRFYALKVLQFAPLPGTPRPTDPVERFLREARAVARIGKHPNIVQIHDVGFEGTCYYFAMDLVEGQALDRRIAGTPMPQREAAAIAAKVAHALQVAHEAGIVHRDLKPSNILLTKDGVPQVTDFGLARDASTGSTQAPITEEGQVLGTLQYMAPEQAAGDQDRIGPATDVYGLGATLYEMLTGAPPFLGATKFELLAKVLDPDPVLPKRLRPDLHVDLETICLKAMHRDPERRYASARAMGEDLDRFLAGEPILARPVSTMTRFASRMRRHRRLLVTIAIAAACVAGFGAWAVVSSRKATDVDAKRREAEASQRAALATLEKAGKAQAVLSRWAALSEDVRALERVRYDTSLPDAEKLRRAEPLWKGFQDFVDETPRDPASQSTMKALAGWARRLARTDAEGISWMREAAAIDADLPYGTLLEALTCFSGYLARQDLPSIVYGESGLEFGPSPPETAVMKELRARMEGLLSRAASAQVWGAGMAEEFRAAIEAIRAVQEGRYAEAEKGLTSALGSAAMQGFRTDLLLARAQVRYLRKEFPEGLGDLEKAKDARPGQAEVFYYLGMMSSGDGLERLARGEDPIPQYDAAIADFDEAVRRVPGFVAGWVNRGIAFVGKADAQKQHGLDPQEALRHGIRSYREALHLSPDALIARVDCGHALLQLADSIAAKGEDARETYDAAIACLTEAARMDETFAETYNNRGIAHKGKADALASRGLDPREEFRRAVEDFGQALARQPENVRARINRGVAWVRLGDAQAARGEDPSPAYSSGTADLDEAVKRDSKSYLARMDRGNAFEARAKWEAAHGQDTRPLHDHAIEDYGKALESNPSYSDAYLCRGLARLAKGGVEAAAGKDARSDFRKAIADLDEAVRIKPDNVRALNGRGLAWKDLGDATLAAKEDPKKAYRKAIADYGEALRWNARFSDGHMNRASVWLSLALVQADSGEDPRESDDKAIADLDQALHIDPANALSWGNRGAAKLQRGDHEGARGGSPAKWWEPALADFAESLARNPANWMARANRGMLYERMEKLEEAVKEYEEGLAKTPGQPFLAGRLKEVKARLAALPAWAQLAGNGEAAVQRGDYAAARKLYEEAFSAAGATIDAPLRPTAMNGHYNLACIYSLLCIGKGSPSSSASPPSASDAARFRDLAFEHLRAALSLGPVDRAHLDADADLVPLHDDPRWKDLPGAVR